jgi:hypothetical protein
MPANGDVDVPVTSTVRVQFTEAVFNVETSFTVSTGPSPVLGSISSLDPLNYVFNPSTPLPAASTIDVTLGGSISDAAGNHLLVTTFSFNTVP